MSVNAPNGLFLYISYMIYAKPQDKGFMKV